MSLPSCPYAKTPNFVLNLDESLGGKLNCWSGSGTQKRFYVTFIALIVRKKKKNVTTEIAFIQKFQMILTNSYSIILFNLMFLCK